MKLDQDILKLAGKLMRDNKNLYLADSIIAATALIKELQLFTFNERHFFNTNELKILPYTIFY